MNVSGFFGKSFEHLLFSLHNLRTGQLGLLNWYSCRKAKWWTHMLTFLLVILETSQRSYNFGLDFCIFIKNYKHRLAQFYNLLNDTTCSNFTIIEHWKGKVLVHCCMWPTLISNVAHLLVPKWFLNKIL